MTDSVNGHLEAIRVAIHELVEDIKEVKTEQRDTNNRLRRVEGSQERVEERLDGIMKRCSETRARVLLCEKNIVDVARNLATVEDRQRGWAGVQTAIAAVLATMAAVVGAIVGTRN